MFARRAVPPGDVDVPLVRVERVDADAPRAVHRLERAVRVDGRRSAGTELDAAILQIDGGAQVVEQLARATLNVGVEAVRPAADEDPGLMRVVRHHHVHAAEVGPTIAPERSAEGAVEAVGVDVSKHMDASERAANREACGCCHRSLPVVDPAVGERSRSRESERAATTRCATKLEP